MIGAYDVRNELGVLLKATIQDHFTSYKIKQASEYF